MTYLGVTLTRKRNWKGYNIHSSELWDIWEMDPYPLHQVVQWTWVYLWIPLLMKIMTHFSQCNWLVICVQLLPTVYSFLPFFDCDSELDHDINQNSACKSHNTSIHGDDPSEQEPFQPHPFYNIKNTKVWR